LVCAGQPPSARRGGAVRARAVESLGTPPVPRGPRPMRRRHGPCACLLLLVAPATVLGGSNSRLAVAPDGRRLSTANPDNGSTSLVALEARTVVAEAPVGRGPEGVCYLGDTPRVAVALGDEDQVVVVDLGTRTVARRIEVPDEPYGVVASRDGR